MPDRDRRPLRLGWKASAEQFAPGDLLRWGLSRRGFAEGPPVVADTQDGALTRLLTERNDVLQSLAGAKL